MQFFPHLLKIGYVDDVVKDVITDTLLDDPSCNTDYYFILLDLLFALPEGARGLSGAFFNEIPYVFLYKHGSRQVEPSWLVGKALELLLSRSVGGVVVPVFVYCIFLMSAQALNSC